MPPPSTTRRKFLCACAAGGACLALDGWAGAAATNAAPAKPIRPLSRALFWEALPRGRTRCLTCPNHCESAEGGVTRCKTRVNRGGVLYTLTHSRPCVIHIDPLEKNPLFHVSPGQSNLVTATAGCNLSCSYCQNWDISQVGPEKTKNMDIPPDALVQRALDRSLKWISFSYTEPVAYYEYAVDVATLARARGLKVAMVTAGIIDPKPLEKLMAVSDAFSVTLKGDTPGFYKNVCGANIDTVWQTLRRVVQAGLWVEVVTLIIPGLNDDEPGLRSMARKLATLSPNIPLHYLRFFPMYKLKHLTTTPVATLERARDGALKEGLKFVYISNLPGHAAAQTNCPSCKKCLIERVGFKVVTNRIRESQCPFCATRIPGLDLAG